MLNLAMLLLILTASELLERPELVKYSGCQTILAEFCSEYYTDDLDVADAKFELLMKDGLYLYWLWG